MGTRSLTIVLDGNNELCRIYRQFDGYPSGHGYDLAKACNVTLVNGFSENEKKGKHANGMPCLAATIIGKLKAGIGNIYLEPTGGEISDWAEYVYVVRGDAGGEVIIECRTNAVEGAWPFNLQTKSELVFSGNAKQWLAHLKVESKRAKLAAVS